MTEIVMMSGSAKVRLDDKGRLAMPNRYREALAAEGGLTLTMHPHKHLALYTPQRFAALRDQVLRMPNLGHEAAHLQELLVGCAEDVTLDGAGRLMVSGALRGMANIERDVLLFGLGDKLHIWDERAWTQRDTVIRARLQDAEMSEQWRNMTI